MNSDMITALILAFVGTPLLLWMLSDKVSTRIRNSDSWFIAWIFYIIALPNVGCAWMYLADHL